MTKREYHQMVESNNAGRPLLDLFRLPAHPKAHGVDLLAARESTLARLRGEERQTELKLYLLDTTSAIDGSRRAL